MRMKCVLVLDMQSAQGGGSLRARVCVRACVGGWEGGRRAREQKRGETPMAESTTTLHAKPRTKPSSSVASVEEMLSWVKNTSRRSDDDSSSDTRSSCARSSVVAEKMPACSCSSTVICAQGRRSLRGEAVPGRLEARRRETGSRASVRYEERASLAGGASGTARIRATPCAEFWASGEPE